MSKLVMAGVGMIVVFFLAVILAGFPFVGQFALPISHIGLLLPAGLALIFMGNPQIMFIVFLGGTIFLVANGIPLIP